jgi:hypothetical protein
MIPFKKVEVIKPRKSIFGQYVQYFYYDGILRPSNAIKGNKLYKITTLDSMYDIHSLTILTRDDKIEDIHSPAIHPNINPDTSLYCLSPEYKDLIFSVNLFQTLLRLMSTYYLDNCYFNPIALENQVIFEEQPTIKFNRKGEVIYIV